MFRRFCCILHQLNSSDCDWRLPFVFQDGGIVLKCFKVFYNFCKTIEWACKRMGCLHGGLNTGPTAYKAGALPLSYEGWEPSQQRSYEGWEPSQQRSYEGMRLIKRQVRAIPLTRCYNSVRGKYTPGGGRTHDLPLRRRTRYPLRYWSVRLLPINLVLS